MACAPLSPTLSHEGRGRLAPGEKYGVTSAPAHPLKGEEFFFASSCGPLLSSFAPPSFPPSLVPERILNEPLRIEEPNDG